MVLSTLRLGAAALLLAPATAAPGADIVEKFEQFKKLFNKHYTPAEEQRRLEFFALTVAKAELMKTLDPSAEHTYLTPLADMSEEEYVRRNNLQVRTVRVVFLKIVLFLRDFFRFVRQKNSSGVF